MPTPCPQPQNNIYVGARYVPIFAGTWDKTKTYEPLMIVEYQGNSYTSKTYVPAGIDITNDTYWSLTGNYNAQVEAYRKETQAVADQLDTIQTDLGDLGNQVNQNTNTLTKLNTNFNNTTLLNKKIYILGDSNSSAGESNWPGLLPNYIPQTNTVTNLSRSGTTISKTGGWADSILKTVIDGNPAPDIAIVFLGLNDFNQQVPIGNFGTASPGQATIDTFAGSVISMCNQLYTSWPNTICYFVTVPKSWSPNIADLLIPKVFYNFALANIPKAWGYNIIDFYSNAPLLSSNGGNKWYRDALHLLPSYAPFMAKFFADYLLNGKSDKLGDVLTYNTLNKYLVAGIAERGSAIPYTINSQGWITAYFNDYYHLSATTTTIANLPACFAPAADYDKQITVRGIATPRGAITVTSGGQINVTATYSEATTNYGIIAALSWQISNWSVRVF